MQTPALHIDVSHEGAVASFVDPGLTVRTANRVAIEAAAVLAETLGVALYFPSVNGLFWTDKRVHIHGAVGLHIQSDGMGGIRYPSDDVSVGTENIPGISDVVPISKTRAALLLSYCTDCTIERMKFVGGTNPDLININQAPGIAATRTRGLTVLKCTSVYGGSLLQQDDGRFNSTGTGDQIEIADGVATMTGSEATFSRGVVGRTITISGTTDTRLCGSYIVASYISPNSITFAAPTGAFPESSSFKWFINNGDDQTTVQDCRIYGARNVLNTCTNSRVLNCHFELPANLDICGTGGKFLLEGDIVTFTSAVERFLPSHHGKYFKIVGALSSDANDPTATVPNNGTFKITYIDATHISWTNASGRSEVFPTSPGSTWWVINGDKAGEGAGAGALSQLGGPDHLLTVTASSAMFSVDDVASVLRINGATTRQFNGSFPIVSYVSPTVVIVQNAIDLDVTEAFTGVITIDHWDHGTLKGDSIGSTHAIYIFAGRSNILVDGCTFKNIRTTAMKVSGSTIPIQNIRFTNNYAVECGIGVLFGADDSQEHTGLICTNNTFVDCSSQRAGWDTGSVIGILGSRNITIANNQFHYTHNAIGSVNGAGNPANAISVARYVAGRSQPVEDVLILGNKFTGEPSQVDGAKVFASAAIHLYGVGLKAKYNTAGSLARGPGDVMTLTDDRGIFLSKEDVGKSVEFVNCTPSTTDLRLTNNGTFTIETCTKTTFTFTNKCGFTTKDALNHAVFHGGTYRIAPRAAKRGASCVIAANEFYDIGATAIITQDCVGLEIRDNILQNSSGIYLNGDCCPRVTGNREVGASTTLPRLKFVTGTSWPYAYDNTVCNQAMGVSITRDMQVAVRAGGSAPAVDHPLLGRCGRVRPSDGREEVVISYGTLPVDGDTLKISGTGLPDTTLTYKEEAPGPGQFNTYAIDDNNTGKVSLMTRINAIPDLSCADYGTGLAGGDVATNHLRIRRTIPSANNDGMGLSITCTSLNPTFLVAPRNGKSSPPRSISASESRGSGSAGPVADKTVIWSPACTGSNAVLLVPDNDSARNLLAVGTLATGTITSVSKADLIDSDFLTINDGVNPSRIYEFDTDGIVTDGRIRVDISADTTAAQTAERLRAAIIANQPVFSVVSEGSGKITLTHNLGGPAFNVAITKNVNSAGFVVTGMAGGTIGGYVSLKSLENGGSCDLVQHGRSAGTEEFRFIV